MKVLFLGYKENQILDFLRALKYDVIQEDKKLKLEEIKEINPQHIVSYGYSHIIKSPVLKEYPNILNLHIAYLPWNKGANPNFWSWLEHTPKGYTIHYMDEGIDTGPILFQKEAEFDKNEDLSSSYVKLRKGIEELFMENWNVIANGEVEPKKQNPDEGSFHYVKDLEKYRFLFQEGEEKIKPKQSDVPVKKIEHYGKKNKIWLK